MLVPFESIFVRNTANHKIIKKNIASVGFEPAPGFSISCASCYK
jgi:hypothetical protein